MRIQSILYVAALFAITACSNQNDKRFRFVPASESGITFANTLKESVEFNIFNYMYFYNGAGVAVGDVNGDDLPDIYFTSNQEPNKLYLNQGNFKFKDITEVAGVEGFNGWTTGVTMADVNNDGRLDIYVGYIGDYLIYKGKNQLFINEGNNEDGTPRFTDRAVEFGLDLVGFSTQAAFFDYDRDGDLDMFMLNHSLHENGTFGRSTMRNVPHALAGDKLMRNDNGHFVDVTAGSGIYSSALGYGLGVAVSDVNLDGWPDIYVGNDFHENDYLYINQGNGSFKEVLEQSMPHTSRYTMGVDMADFNNDAFPDIIAMDMLPGDPLVLKASAAEDVYDVYNFKINYGFNHQFARNTLQMNNGNGTFSDIALLAGVSATDWSWSALFADFDLDGRKDIFVSNGILRRSNDLDYINFISVDSVQMKMKYDMSEREMKYAEKMPKVRLTNYLFVNNGDSTFSDRSADWGFDKLSYSHGSAYADFDNDGDLDLVINNVEDQAFLYENRTIKKDKAPEDSTNHYLQVILNGKGGNLRGIGAKVILYNGGRLQLQECMPTRGYESSVDDRLLFGTGAERKVDSVLVIWNDGSHQTVRNISTNQRITLKQQDATGIFDYSVLHPRPTLFADATEGLNLNYKHQENRFVEFNREALIPHMMSAEGPAFAVADVNGDGLEDFYVSGSKRIAGKIYVQTVRGTFVEQAQPLFRQDSVFEFVDAVFFDADGDKDQDLLAVSGGNEFSGKSLYCMPRLYKNDGHGNFSQTGTLPEIYMTGACARLNDIDNDGDLDIFLGARSIPWRYGIPPDSYILRNDGNAAFTDITDAVAPSLRKFGFVKSATWADVDGDKDNDLIIAAEWSPITILYNDNGKLASAPLPGSGLENTQGWWNTIQVADIDNDGDLDMVAGNLGLNSKLHASLQEPVRFYVKDFDKNDSIDQVLTYYMRGQEYPFYTRDEMTKQMPFLKKRYLSYHKYAEANFHQIFPDEALKDAKRYEAYTFRSAYIENLGNRKFSVHPLPQAAQLSTVNTILVEDFDGDNKPDVLLAGNFYPINIQMGRNDASYGMLLKGNGKGNFTPIPAVQSGFSVRGETRHLQPIHVGGNILYFAVRNSDSIMAFKRIQP